MKVVLAIDGTRYGEAATEMIGNLQLRDGDSITVISIVDMAMPLVADIYGGYLPDTSELEKMARESAAKVVDAARHVLVAKFEEQMINVIGDVLFGSPDSRIVETAENIGADLIVIGSHGYKQWERLLLGSVSSSVVHHAPCSVLVVRTSA